MTMTNNELWAKYRSLVFYGMNRHYGKARVYALGLDAEQVAWEILQRAVKKYDPTKGSKLSYYIYQWTRGTKTFVRAIQMGSPTQNLADPVGDYVETFADTSVECDAHYVIETLSKLAPRTADIIARHAIAEDTLEEIAEDYGLTRERVRQINLDGLARLRASGPRPPRGTLICSSERRTP